MAGFVERRECIRAHYQTFDSRESDYRLHPYHLLAYHGNWCLLAHNEGKIAWPPSRCRGSGRSRGQA
jgi:predicted DNA-binding transcriptional regulator YafY